jgi:hypothetical protein
MSFHKPCFEQTEKNITYKIEEYEGLDNRWESTQFTFNSLESAIEFYENNSNFNLTKEQEQNHNFNVYRIIEIKTTTKPIITNTTQLKILIKGIKKLRKEGRLR